MIVCHHFAQTFITFRLDDFKKIGSIAIKLNIYKQKSDYFYRLFIDPVVTQFIGNRGMT